MFQVMTNHDIQTTQSIMIGHVAYAKSVVASLYLKKASGNLDPPHITLA